MAPVVGIGPRVVDWIGTMPGVPSGVGVSSWARAWLATIAVAAAALAVTAARVRRREREDGNVCWVTGRLLSTVHDRKDGAAWPRIRHPERMGVVDLERTGVTNGVVASIGTRYDPVESSAMPTATRRHWSLPATLTRMTSRTLP